VKSLPHVELVAPTRMKQAALYQAILLREWKSSVMAGMAVATMPWRVVGSVSFGFQH